MNISITAIEAKLTNVKLNSEGSQDNPTSRTDLSFECLGNSKQANTFLRCDVEKIFWDKDGNILLLGITGIKSRAELKDATMEFGDLKVQHVKVRKLEFNPVNGKQIMFTMQVQVHHTDEELNKFDRLQMTTHLMKIYTSQKDLFEE